jgi:PPK2 family polyphosphate:nucleotide phosphotransferase
MGKPIIASPKKKTVLSQANPDHTGQFTNKEDAQRETEELLSKIDLLQYRLFAEGKQSLLIILQGMDTCGKDGTIRHVFKGVSPQGCVVTSFQEPTPEELKHDFLWRTHQKTPAKGQIAIHNRSHYEDVLVPRVHGEITRKNLKARIGAINDCERLLTSYGMTIVKFFLLISKDEQRKRLQDRLEKPHKRWKFKPSDLNERKYWDDYMRAYDEAIQLTSTPHAPWYLIPANHDWYRNNQVAKVICQALEKMNPQFPPECAGVDFKQIRIPL